jgi:hypothetical protein
MAYLSPSPYLYNVLHNAGPHDAPDITRGHPTLGGQLSYFASWRRPSSAYISIFDFSWSSPSDSEGFAVVSSGPRGRYENLHAGFSSSRFGSTARVISKVLFGSRVPSPLAGPRAFNAELRVKSETDFVFPPALATVNERACTSALSAPSPRSWLQARATIHHA